MNKTMYNYYIINNKERDFTEREIMEVILSDIVILQIYNNI